jgi:hypothetical protein
MLELLIGIAAFGVLALVLLNRFVGHVPGRPMNQAYYQAKWEELLGMVKSPEGMVLAVINADKLVDHALKRRGFRGKTMGERLVSAQRSISDNDAIWYAHKLRNRLVHEDHPSLTPRDAQKALGGFNQVLRDVGAL